MATQGSIQSPVCTTKWYQTTHRPSYPSRRPGSLRTWVGIRAAAPRRCSDKIKGWVMLDFHREHKRHFASQAKLTTEQIGDWVQETSSEGIRAHLGHFWVQRQNSVVKYRKQQTTKIAARLCQFLGGETTIHVSYLSIFKSGFAGEPEK